MKADECGLGKGSVSGLTTLGGQAPFTFRWSDEQGTTVSADADLAGVKAGTFTLTITDATGGCPVIKEYTVINEDYTLPAPVAKDVQICAAGVAVIVIDNPQGKYRLYEIEVAASPSKKTRLAFLRLRLKVPKTFI